MFELHSGFSISNVPKSVGDRVTVKYHGLLAKGGADTVWMRTGYDSSWRDVYDYKMSKTGEDWEATIEAKKTGQLNFCFKDSADNWDNNNGLNWSYHIGR